MAACGSLQHIFEKSLPEKPTPILESLSSWNQIKPVIEMFGELNFNESSQSSSSSSSSSSSTPFPTSSSSLSSSSSSTSWHDLNLQNKDALDVRMKTPPPSPVSFAIAGISNDSHTTRDSFFSNSETPVHGFKYKSESFSSMNSESLQLCTEGLGFESFDDVEDLKNEDWQNQQDEVSTLPSKQSHSQAENLCGEFRRPKASRGRFPPPISCIGQSGKPWVSFKSYRHDGRFVLKEIRMPSQEFLHACREDGRLKLQFVQPSDEILELEEDEEEEGEEEEDCQEDEDEFEVDLGEGNVSICDVKEDKREAHTSKCEGHDLQ